MPVVLVSRGSFSGAKAIAECLSTCAGWTCLTREDLIASVNAHGEIANQVIASVPRAAQNYAQFSLLRAPYKILMRLALLEYVRRGIWHILDTRAIFCFRLSHTCPGFACSLQ